MAKAIAMALVMLVVASWAGYHGYRAASSVWSSPRPVDCRAFLAGSRPQAKGQKVALLGCKLDFAAAAGVGFKHGSKAHTVFIPLAPRPAKAQWELALITDEPAMLAAVRSPAARSAAVAQPREIVGVIVDAQGQKPREQFTGMRRKPVLFVDRVGTFELVFGLGFLAFALVLVLSAVATIVRSRGALKRPRRPEATAGRD